jgi:septal ring factor EnvC (AmiA/AmiB activator)
MVVMERVFDGLLSRGYPVKNKRLIVLFAVLVLSLTTFCYAEGQGIHQRVRVAHDRIDRGVHSGSLTREEAHSLKNQLNSIRDDEARMKADGRLTHHERERLERELDRLERHISRAKRNDNRRY